jgi:uncharacterized protein
MSTATIANHYKSTTRSASRQQATRRKKIWVDLDNSPHVPFFRPILEEMRKRNYEVMVTARDAYQVRELLDYYGVSARVVGKHYGKQKLWKALGTCWRTLVLIPLVRKEKPDLAVCHGSRGLVLTSKLLGIPSLVLMDYEFATLTPFVNPTWRMLPSVVPDDALGCGSNVIKYPGIKEDVYLSTFQPDLTLRNRLGIASDDLLITVRPPATEAHYHNPEAEKLLSATLRRFVNEPNTTILLLPRNKRQESELRSAWAESIASRKIIIPEHAEDGLNLIWNSDLVISGGGTMNREAAAMGVPVYSIFRGKIGAVDHYLSAEQRLVLLETVEDIRTRINAVRRHRAISMVGRNKSQALETIVQYITNIVEGKMANPTIAGSRQG